MTDKAPTDKTPTDKDLADLDAALAALRRAERAVRPEVSAALRERVLEKAAGVREAQTAGPRPRRKAPAADTGGWLGWLGRIDAWAGAAVAAAVICLAVGLGLGYRAGDEVLAEAGLQQVRLAQADGDEPDGVFMPEDVL